MISDWPDLAHEVADAFTSGDADQVTWARRVLERMAELLATPTPEPFSVAAALLFDNEDGVPLRAVDMPEINACIPGGSVEISLAPNSRAVVSHEPPGSAELRAVEE